MNPKKFRERPIRVAGTTKVVPITTDHLDADYVLIPNSDAPESSAGWIVVATLLPNSTTLPTFYMRWDRNDEMLDVDIHIDGKNRRKRWKKPSYKGHHPVLINRDAQEYKVHIQIPDRTVFKGVVRVGLLVGLNLHDTVPTSEHVVVQIK